MLKKGGKFKLMVGNSKKKCECNFKNPIYREIFES